MNPYGQHNVFLEGFLRFNSYVLIAKYIQRAKIDKIAYLALIVCEVVHCLLYEGLAIRDNRLSLISNRES